MPLTLSASFGNDFVLLNRRRFRWCRWRWRRRWRRSSAVLTTVAASATAAARAVGRLVARDDEIAFQFQRLDRTEDGCWRLSCRLLLLVLLLLLLVLLLGGVVVGG